MSQNPFKFGAVVDDPFFTNRKQEIAEILAFLESENHLLISSPRRFGKTSLILKCVQMTTRPWIYLDLQLITSLQDFSSQLLRRLYNRFPLTKMKTYLKNFRILPQMNFNPLTNDVSISYLPDSDTNVILEDLFMMIQKIANEKRLIIIFDEFQEIFTLGQNLDKQLRGYLQQIKGANFIFLGSREALVNEIFSKKKSPFYHFAMPFQISKIEKAAWIPFLVQGLTHISQSPERLAAEILQVSRSHPYYTQQLAAMVWQFIQNEGDKSDAVDQAVQFIITQHDSDYERLWLGFNQTDKKVLLALAQTETKPLSDNFLKKWNIGAVSTVYSSIKRLTEQSYLLKQDGLYEIEDPFFKQWLIFRRNRFVFH